MLTKRLNEEHRGTTCGTSLPVTSIASNKACPYQRQIQPKVQYATAQLFSDDQVIVSKYDGDKANAKNTARTKANPEQADNLRRNQPAVGA